MGDEVRCRVWILVLFLAFDSRKGLVPRLSLPRVRIPRLRVPSWKLIGSTMVNKVLADTADTRAADVVIEPQRIPRLVKCPTVGEEQMLPRVDTRDTAGVTRGQQTRRGKAIDVWGKNQIP